MKVRELIDLLSKEDPGARVILRGFHNVGDYHEARLVSTQPIRYRGKVDYELDHFMGVYEESADEEAVYIS